MSKEQFIFHAVSGYFFRIIYTLLLLVTFGVASCKKAVKINEPVNTITSTGTFSSDATATSAIIGIYSNLINTGLNSRFGNGTTTLYTGLSSDELSRISITGSTLEQYIKNSLLSDNNTLTSQLWGSAYFTIYQANSCIEGLQKSSDVNNDLKKRLIGECKFLRAFAYFYLTNLWNDIPMPLTSDWNHTYLLSRTSKEEVYQQIINDLKDAQEVLSENFSASNNERIRANKITATALLARVYLYLQDWPNAEAQSSIVINNTTNYTLVNDLNKVFLKNSTEAILQFQPTNNSFPYTVTEQYTITQSSQYYYATPTLLNAFETNDPRKTSWLSTAMVSGVTYYYPNKYKIKQGTSGGIITEYYMVLRLAEQYLIRAEAYAQQNKIPEAKGDLNKIRTRANLPIIIASDKASMLLAIEHERQIELFAEWGHRWLDLKRTNRADSVLGPIKGSNWQSTDQLYPIPYSELQRNPNLTQNPGYN